MRPDESLLPDRAWPRWGLIAFVVALWTLPGAVALSYYYLDQIVTGQPFDWTYALVTTLPNWYLWALLTPLIVWLAARFRLERGHAVRRLLLVHVPAMVVLLGLHALGNLLIFRVAGLHDAVTPALFRVHYASRIHANILTYWTVLGAYYAFDYYRKYHKHERQAAALEVQLARAHLRALKMQLHPHFLFNTLHAIAALVRKEETQTAVQMLGRLGEFLRLALESQGEQEIPLERELDFVQRYLAIEQVRFGDRLRVEVEAEPGVLSAYVPNLILQPLVENAIHHGIAPHAEAGRLAIRVQAVRDRLVLSVEDDGPGLEAPSKRANGTGVGLSNIRERLAQLYGDRATLVLETAPQGGTRATITLPFYQRAVYELGEATYVTAEAVR